MRKAEAMMVVERSFPKDLSWFRYNQYSTKELLEFSANLLDHLSSRGVNITEVADRLEGVISAH
jgi:hypothetical protein